MPASRINATPPYVIDAPYGRAAASPNQSNAGAVASISEFRIDSDPEYQSLSAVNTDKVPSVTIKGGNLTLATKKPLKAPIKVPIAIPAAIASGSGTPVITASRPITNEDKTKIAPTERSIPAVKIIRVCAIATMPMTVTCWRTNDRTPGLKNLGAKKPKTKILTTKTKAGTSVG